MFPGELTSACELAEEVELRASTLLAGVGIIRRVSSGPVIGEGLILSTVETRK